MISGGETLLGRDRRRHFQTTGAAARGDPGNGARGGINVCVTGSVRCREPAPRVRPPPAGDPPPAPGAAPGSG
jgi:hypothetical protein